MSGLKSRNVGNVWLVWDGPGGHVFQVCATKRDAAICKRFHRDYPSVKVVRFDFWNCEVSR